MEDDAIRIARSVSRGDFNDERTVANARPICRKDIRHLRKIRTKSGRKVYFLLMVRCGNRPMKIKEETISKIIGYSQRTVQSEIKWLTANDWIAVEPGKRNKTRSGFFVNHSNTYTVNRKPREEDDSDPYRVMMVQWSEVTREFNRAYYSVSDALLTEDERQSYMTAVEQKEFAKAMREERGA